MNDFFGGFSGDGWGITVGTGGGGYYGGGYGGQVYYPPYTPGGPVFPGQMHPQTQQLLLLGAVVVVAYLLLK